MKANTTRNYRASLKTLECIHIGNLRLKDIDVGHFRDYQRTRGRGGRPLPDQWRIECPAADPEGSGEWDRIRPFYKPIRVPKRRGGHSISADEERAVAGGGVSRPKWRFAAHCMIVMLSTTMGFGELRHIDAAM